ncbi:MAG TPA: hypothetical protein PKC36_03960, partial [Dietzia sp.]|nr:hypothetical protein [Dietzia sp.]
MARTSGRGLSGESIHVRGPVIVSLPHCSVVDGGRVRGVSRRGCPDGQPWVRTVRHELGGSIAGGAGA